MMLRTISMSLFLHSCQINTCSQDLEIHQHVERFFLRYDEDQQNVCDAKYGDPELGNYGLATIYPHRCDIIILNGLEPFTEKYVIYHEIGHCLGLDHVDNPRSIMYDTALDEQFTATTPTSWSRNLSNYSKKTNTEYYRYYYRAHTGKLLKRNMMTGNVEMWDIDYQYMSRGFMMSDDEPSNVPDSTWMLNVPEKYR